MSLGGTFGNGIHTGLRSLSVYVTRQINDPFRFCTEVTDSIVESYASAALEPIAAGFTGADASVGDVSSGWAAFVVEVTAAIGSGTVACSGA